MHLIHISSISSISSVQILSCSLQWSLKFLKIKTYRNLPDTRIKLFTYVYLTILNFMVRCLALVLIRYEKKTSKVLQFSLYSLKSECFTTNPPNLHMYHFVFIGYTHWILKSDAWFKDLILSVNNSRFYNYCFLKCFDFH